MQKAGKTALMPKLRFPEFRGTWRNEPLETLGYFTGGGTPSKDNAAYWTGDIPWISSSDLNEDSIHQVNVSRFITKQAVEESATKLVPAKSILLISRVGVGKLALSTFPLCTSQDFTNFTPTAGDPLFLAYLLKSQRKILLSFNQGTSIKGFTKDDIATLRLGFPSLPEQQKIADCLTSLDEAITAQARKVDALKKHKKGLMQELFPREGETHPRLRFPEFQDAGEWVMKKLGEFAEVSASGDLEMASFAPELSESHRFPIYSNGVEKEGLYGFSTIAKHPAGSVTITARGTLGRAFLRTTDFVGIGRLIVISDFKDEVHPDFLKECWDHLAIIPREVTSIPQLTAITARSTPLPFPCLPEQQRIASCLSNLDSLITAGGRKLDTLKAHKKGLMQQLFPSSKEAEK